MKKRNYVAAVGMIALLIQSGGACAMLGAEQSARVGGFVHRKAAKLKKKTVDKMYDKAKDFAKEAKELRKCRKNNDCTPEQKRKIRVAEAAALAAVGTGAAAVTVGGVAYLARGLRKKPQPSKQMMTEGDNKLLQAANNKNYDEVQKLLFIGKEYDKVPLSTIAIFFSVEGLQLVRKKISQEVFAEWRKNNIIKKIEKLLSEMEKAQIGSLG